MTYAAEPQQLLAGRKAWLDLEFHVDPGFHINSHTPQSELLIPTDLTMGEEGGVEVGKLEYPAGSPYSLPAQPDEKLDVYTGSFRVRLQVMAGPGEHELKAVLRYQACDQAACYPPRTLPIEILFHAK